MINFVNQNFENNLEIVKTTMSQEVEQYRFPHGDYKIVGDAGEIDKIINCCGFINLDASDIKSTLSADATNFVTIGKAVGEGCIAKAYADALDKLPIGADGISKMLFQIWIPRNNETNISDLVDLQKNLPSDIDIVWGVAYDESLEGKQARITLVAASN